MSMHPSPVPPVPEETRRVAHRAFPKGNLCLRLRDEFTVLFTDPEFQDLFPSRGQPAEAPWRLALVTLLQFAEDLSDRQAADAVRARLDWKYLLSLELTDPGFHHSVLGEFRARLLRHDAGIRLLERLLQSSRERGLVKARGCQRTDATHVLAAVHRLNRLELVGETLRQALNALAVTAPAWLRGQCDPEWGTRYGRRWPAQRLPRGRAEREALAWQVGADGYALLTALFQDGPAAARALPEVEVLRQVWLQQYYREEAASPTAVPAPVGEARLQHRWRTAAELPPAPLRINSPVDPEARYSKHGEAAWLGYTQHVTETCEPELPLLLTDTQTVLAPTPDGNVLPAIQAALVARALPPERHLVDSGYVDATALVASKADYGITLVGPPLENYSWQAREGQGFAARDFTVDWAAHVAHCPSGKQSVQWREHQQAQEPVVTIVFAPSDCQACPLRSQCTQAKAGGRAVTLRAEAGHRALETAREYANSAAFAQEYGSRAGVEGTHSQGVRRCGLRRCRYLGLAKTTLQHQLTAAALNLIRIGEWLLATPRARTRIDAFQRLLATAT